MYMVCLHCLFDCAACLIMFYRFYQSAFELLPDVQGALCRSLSAGVCPQPMPYQLGTDLEQICELQIDGHLFEAFCNSLRSEAHAGRLTVSARRCHTAKPMPLQRCRFEGDGAQSGPPCPECGPPISSWFLCLHGVARSASPNLSKSQVIEETIQFLPQELKPGQADWARSLTFQKKFQTGRKWQTNLFLHYMFLPFVQENAPDLVTERTLLSLHPLQGSARSAGAWLARWETSTCPIHSDNHRKAPFNKNIDSDEIQMMIDSDRLSWRKHKMLTWYHVITFTDWSPLTTQEDARVLSRSTLFFSGPDVSSIVCKNLRKGVWRGDDDQVSWRLSSSIILEFRIHCITVK